MARDEVWERVVELSAPYEAPGYEPGKHVINARVGLSKLAGNEHAYWTATAEVRVRGTRSDAGLVACGAMTDEIARVFPEAALIARLHLADENGTPMHSEANALYHLGLSGRHEEIREPHRCRCGHEHQAVTGRRWVPWVAWPAGRENAARHLRVAPETVDSIRSYIVEADGQDSEALRFIIKTSLRPLWDAEATAAHAWLDEKLATKEASNGMG